MPTAARDARDAVQRLFRTHGPRIRALALRMCGRPADADDVVQDVFLQAYRKWSQFEGRSEPGTWLYTIAVRACRRHLRKRRTREARMPALSAVSPFHDTTVAEIDPRAREPFTGAQARESVRALEAAILQLPEAFRLAITLKDVLEMETEDVAAVLGVRPQTVKTRVHRARFTLRKTLMKRLPQSPAPDPIYERQVCLDLLRAKLAAMDRGRHAPIGRQVACDRCRAVFAELDLTQDVCRSLGDDTMPAPLRSRIERLLGDSGPAPSRR